MENAGYAIQTAHIWTPDWAVAASILVFFAVGMAGAYLFYSQYPMDWQEVKVSKDAEKVFVETEDYPANEGRMERIEPFHGIIRCSSNGRAGR